MKKDELNNKNFKENEKNNFEILNLRDFFRDSLKKDLNNYFRDDFWMLIFITGGKGSHTIDFKEYNYEKENLVILKSRSVHSFGLNNNLDGYIIKLKESFFFEELNKEGIDLLNFFDFLPNNCPILKIKLSNNSTNKIILDLIFKEYLEFKKNNSKNLIRSLFKSLVYSIFLNKNEDISFSLKPEYKYYKKYCELVEMNFKILKVVNHYSKLMGVSVKTINSACRKFGNISAKQLLINRIILEAKRLLIFDELKIYEISYYLGFNEPGNFSAFFKKYCGISMNEFKNNSKKSII